jgi:pyruvate/2-oxoglutarate dehydrogenase complex dihydrolipoamide dehydrogenase (E3) component
MSETVFDVVIVGAGQASVPLAAALVEAGKRVALAERRHLGGSCVNFGCTPTKAVIASAKLAHQARRAAEYGVHVGRVEVDFPGVLGRAKRVLLESRESLQSSVDELEGVELFTEHARLEGREGDLFKVRVGEALIRAQGVVLNTGTRTLVPPIEGIDGVEAICAENWLEQTTLPEHLVIVGGSYIGLEMSQFYRRMGSAVTVVESGDRIAAREDEDVARAMQEVLEAEGVTFRLGTRAKRVSRVGDGIVLELEDGAEVRASHLFLASGRKPNTDDLGLETVGVEVDDQGVVRVDERLRSSVPGVWVAGDIRGGPMFTHTAYDDFEVLASQLLGDGSKTSDRLVPYAMFIDPQLGRVGLSEREAREAGRAVKVARYEMKKNGRARELGERSGLIKLVVDADTKQILGAAVLAAEGAELVHVYIALMNARAPYSVLDQAVHIHPTLSEAVKSVVKGLA